MDPAPEHPFWLPPGSIRALIAIIILAAFIVNRMPLEMLTLAVGYYFGYRGTKA